jgi:uncharacterized membrane protein YoaK (UPF0700 family)
VGGSVSKPRQDQRGQEATWMALVLASVAGFGDAVGYIVLHGLFTPHMSGNTARLGALLGHGEASAWRSPLSPTCAVRYTPSRHAKTWAYP